MCCRERLGELAFLWVELLDPAFLQTIIIMCEDNHEFRE